MKTSSFVYVCVGLYFVYRVRRRELLKPEPVESNHNPWLEYLKWRSSLGPAKVRPSIRATRLVDIRVPKRGQLKRFARRTGRRIANHYIRTHWDRTDDMDSRFLPGLNQRSL